MSKTELSCRLIKQYDIYLIPTNDVSYVVDIVTSESSHITYKNTSLYVVQIIHVKYTIYLHSLKRRMRYNPEKVGTHGCKLHVEA